METELLLQVASDTFYYKEGKLFYKGGPYQVKDKEAGWYKPDTLYHCVNICGKQYKTHRIIFLLFHGYLPDYVDHIDRDKTNNRIENLREISKRDNALNSNRSFVGGASFRKDRNKWRAYCKENGKYVSLGHYDTEQEARLAANRRKYGNNVS